MKDHSAYITPIILIISILMACSIYGLYRSNDDSMRPGIGQGDLVLTYKLDRNYTANDLTVYSNSKHKELRRVVAIEGDVVDIAGSQLIINGFPQQEDYAVGQIYRYKDGIDFPVTLKKDEVFLLADSRENAHDSRLYGPVKTKNTKGVVLVVLRHRKI